MLPLGPDPESGLWEFAHLMSGAPARRGADGTLVRTEATGLVLVLLPGGRAWVGAQREDASGGNFDPHASEQEAPVHEVELSPFFLSKYEMTQGQWERLTGRNPSMYGVHNWQTEWNASHAVPSPLQPVEQVSWLDCTLWLRRAGLALPSEAQWEYGARAGTQSAWSTGDEVESLIGAANLRAAPDDPLEDGAAMHTVVGSYSANGFGLHDVHGNVSEWCEDRWDDGDFYRRSQGLDPVAAGSDVDDPRAYRGGTHGEARAHRGGGFGNPPSIARSAVRAFRVPSFSGGALGVRPARAVAY